MFVPRQILNYGLYIRLERAVSETVTLNGMTIPKGIQVGIPVIALHMNPEVWPEPEKFDPERSVA